LLYNRIIFGEADLLSGNERRMDGTERSSTLNPVQDTQGHDEVAFAHVQLYVDKLEDLHVYKALENTLNDFASRAKSESLEGSSPAEDLLSKQQLWREVSGSVPPSNFGNDNRDIVKQLIAGLGFRVTRASQPQSGGLTEGTRSVLITSRDPSGVQFIVTAPDGEATQNGHQTGVFSQGKVP
jgi:hypothetical protein